MISCVCTGYLDLIITLKHFEFATQESSANVNNTSQKKSSGNLSMKCGLMKLRLNCFGRKLQKGSACPHENIIPAVQKSTEGGASWFGAALLPLDSFLSLSRYVTLQDNVRKPVHQLKIRRSWVMQQDNDPKHQRKSAEKTRENPPLEVPSQSSDLNPREMLRSDLKTAVDTRHPCNYGWAEHCAGLICSDRKYLFEATAANGGLFSYWIWEYTYIQKFHIRLTTLTFSS